jgi:CheY-like chemotaxis protein
VPRILIVDDDGIDRELAARCLRFVPQAKVEFATDGTEALLAMSTGAPDLVVTDMRMPRMDGLELMERIHAEFPLVPVILMTSQGNEQTAVRALKAGAASYVPKSLLKSSLAETVDQVLEVTDARNCRRAVLGCLTRNDTEFVLENDPALILSLVGYLQDSLAASGIGDDSLRTQVGMALMEAISNGMIHGNLEVGSDLRRDDRARFDQLIETRRRQEPYASRRLRCSATIAPRRVEYVIQDEGPGFDPRSLPDPTAPENLLAVSGRGILLIRTFMDAVRFNDKGNQVTLIKTLAA